jgi:hypothetical protein
VELSIVEGGRPMPELVDTKRVRATLNAVARVTSSSYVLLLRRRGLICASLGRQCVNQERQPGQP